MREKKDGRRTPAVTRIDLAEMHAMSLALIFLYCTFDSDFLDFITQDSVS